MSYCRLNQGESDVYVYATGDGWQVCLSKSLLPQKRPLDRFCKSRKECFDYLQGIRAAGLKVPERAFERLAKEMLHNDKGHQSEII